MLDLDKWQEILTTLARNKLRAVLTGFSVAWGIFILVVLLGSGRGLENGTRHQFRDDAINSIWIRSGQTSVPHQGMRPGRYVQFTNEDHDTLAETVDGVEHITSRFYVRGNTTVSYGSESGNFDIRSVHPGHLHVERTRITEGRFIHDLDIEQFRKVAVIGIRVVEELFGSTPPIGEYLKVNGVAFKVVGIFEDAGGENEMQKIYLPISTAQRTFNGGNRIAQIMFTTGEAELAATERMAAEVREQLARRHRFSPEDQRAVSINNNNAAFARVTAMLRGIEVFVWLVGVGTLFAGVVGVGNIMLIAVRERTREIGVRKALGATPGSILALILQEAVVVTSVAGYFGLVLGVATLELSPRYLPETEFFRNPAVDLRIAGAATLLLVIAGAIAGLYPAWQAARIAPIEALRDE